MKLRVLLYAACMLITGSINTIATKYQDLSIVGSREDGSPVFFQHPAFQSACMFLGEALCLIPYFLLRWRRRSIKAAQGIPAKPSPPLSYKAKRMLAFAIPTLCDATATTLLNVGLFYTYASTYQMLRGTLVLFTGFFTVLVLRRTLYLHHWLGMVLITAGAAIVGAAAMLTPTANPESDKSSTAALIDGAAAAAARRLLDLNIAHEHMDYSTGVAGAAGGAVHGGVLGGMLGLKWPGVYVTAAREKLLHNSVAGEGSVWGAPLSPEASRAMFGNGMVVLAQGFTALQFILEEKFLGQYRMQPLLAVGIEGAWGVLLCFGAIPLLSFIKTTEGVPLDDAAAAFKAMATVPSLRYAVIGSIFSIGAFNFFGLSVTQALSGASRATIDACRTILIWVFSLASGWETFKNLQVVGFLVLLSGTSLYNELLKSCLPAFSSAWHEYLAISGDEEEGLGDEGDDDHGDGDGDQNSTAAWATDAEAGILKEPLLEAGLENGTGAAAGGAGAGGARSSAISQAGGPRRQSRRISAVSKAHHHHQAVPTMARSMRLGINTLSPHDLAEDDTDEEEEEAALGGSMDEADVADPMMLASTPYFGQLNDSTSGMFRKSSSGLSPRPSIGDITGDMSQQQQQQQQQQPAVLTSSMISQGFAAGGGAGGGQFRSSILAGVTGGSIASAAAAPGMGGSGGYAAFMAQRQEEQQAHKQSKR